MTIEFRCPYCAAPIQVSDDAAGKPGHCPRCAARLTVPRPTGLATPPETTPTETLTASVSEPLLADVPDEAVAVGNTARDRSVADAPQDWPNPAANPPVTSIAHKVRRRSRRSSSLLIPLVCGLILFGGLGWYVWQTMAPPLLSGELPGEELEDVEIPVVVVSVAHSPMPERQRGPLLDDLAAEPIPLLSDRMQVQIRGVEEGLAVSINRGSQTTWYRVDVRGHAGLGKYLSQLGGDLDRSRKVAVETAASEFLQQFSSVREGKAPETSLTPFRDQLALNSLVSGLGYHVVAVVGRRQYPCVAETEDGGLYFLLPPGLKQFELIGRTVDGLVQFPGRFTVPVRPGSSRAPIDEGAVEPSEEPTR